MSGLWLADSLAGTSENDASLQPLPGSRATRRKGRGFADSRSEDTATYESVPMEGQGSGPARCKCVFFLFFHEALVDASTFLLGSVLVTSPDLWTATSGVIFTMLMGWQL